LSISSKRLAELNIVIPKIPEQQKIANFLTAIDTKIEQLTKKQTLLKQYKKGVMQKLFSQELRFKADDGSEFPEWEEKMLGEISTPKQWATISSGDLLESGYSVYGANSFIGYYSKYNHENETVTVTCRGATCGTVSLIPEKSYITGNSMCLDDIESSNYSYKFIYYAISFRGFQDIISGSAQPQIVGSAIKKVKIYIPCLEEQTKIATFLSLIDSKIDLATKQLDATKQFKKALLQQMFV
jgi:type I restriction enzyme S subunit